MGARRGRPTMRLERPRRARFSSTEFVSSLRWYIQRDSVATSVSSSRVGHLQVHTGTGTGTGTGTRIACANGTASLSVVVQPREHHEQHGAVVVSQRARAGAEAIPHARASLGARRGFRRCFFESGPAAPLGPCARSSGRVLNLLDAFPAAAPPASPCAARLRGGGGGGTCPGGHPPGGGSFPSLNRTPHALQSVLGPSGPLRHSGVFCVRQLAHVTPARGAGSAEADASARSAPPRGAPSAARTSRVGSNPTGAGAARAAAGPGAGPSLLATRALQALHGGHLDAPGRGRARVELHQGRHLGDGRERRRAAAREDVPHVDERRRRRARRGVGASPPASDAPWAEAGCRGASRPRKVCVRVVVGESRVMGKGKGQVFRFRFRPSRARRRSRRFRDRDVYTRNMRKEKKTRDALFTQKNAEEDRALVTGSSVALNAGRGPFKPLKVAARNRPRDASSDAGTRDAERNRAADGVSARASAPPRPEACAFPAVRAEWSVAAAS